MVLGQLVDDYLSERVVSNLYAKNLARLAGGVGTLEVNAINRYLRKRLEEVSSVTVSHERAMLVVLWRYAYDRDLVQSMPRGIVKIKSNRPPTRAWTLEQCCTAVKATFQHDNVILRSGCPLGLMMRCWILLGYESGARRGDLWRLVREDFAGDTLWFSQNKTGEPVPKVLSKGCSDAVGQMLARSVDGTVLAWALTAGAAAKRMKTFLNGLRLGGTSKWLRRSSATHIEMRQPGKARLHLGHKTVGLAEKFYIDWTQVNRDIPRAPELLE